MKLQAHAESSQILRTTKAPHLEPSRSLINTEMLEQVAERGDQTAARSRLQILKELGISGGSVWVDQGYWRE